MQLNDIHGHVIKTKPTEAFWGSGGYKGDKLPNVKCVQLVSKHFKFLEVFFSDNNLHP